MIVLQLNVNDVVYSGGVRRRVIPRMATNGPELQHQLPGNINRSPSRESLARNQSRSHLQSTLSYVWTTNDSMLSGDVDRWIGGDTGSPHFVPPPQTRLSTSAQQRDASVIQNMSPLQSSGFWYVAAMVLPLFSINGSRNWRCSPSSLLNTAEMMLAQVAGYCGRARSRVRRMARDQGARDIFAGAMDVVLVVYAFGFLLLSLYQASVFQQF